MELSIKDVNWNFILILTFIFGFMNYSIVFAFIKQKAENIYLTVFSMTQIKKPSKNCKKKSTKIYCFTSSRHEFHSLVSLPSPWGPSCRWSWWRTWCRTPCTLPGGLERRLPWKITIFNNHHVKNLYIYFSYSFECGG